MPKRIQMTRAKGGWRKENPDAVIVARPTKWGNPWAIGDEGVPDAFQAVYRFKTATMGFYSNGAFCPPNAHPESRIGKIIGQIEELRGKDLACWCPLDQPCHADVLLELANRPQEET